MLHLRVPLGGLRVARLLHFRIRDLWVGFRGPSELHLRVPLGDRVLGPSEL